MTVQMSLAGYLERQNSVVIRVFNKYFLYSTFRDCLPDLLRYEWGYMTGSQPRVVGSCDVVCRPRV